MIEISLYRQADNLIELPPILNANGTTPDWSQLSAKMSATFGYASNIPCLDDISTALGSITLALHSSGVGLGVTIHYTPTNLIYGDASRVVYGFGDLHLKVVATGFISAVPIHFTINPGVTIG